MARNPRNRALTRLPARDEPGSVVVDSEPFVGRTACLATLERTWAAIQNRGTSVLIQGVPGIGKTRALQRFADSVRAAGGRILVGHGSAEPGTPALWPFIEIVQGLLRTCSPPRREIGHVVSAFAPWLPRLHGLAAPRRETPDPSQPESQFMLLETLIQLLLDAAQEQPLCVVLEDLQEFDPSSLQLLRRLQRQVQGSSLLVLASCRSDATLGGRDRLLDDVVRGFALRIPLLGLALNEVQALMQLGLGRAVEIELASTVHERAEGNPLYVHALLATLRASNTALPLTAAAVAPPRSLHLAAQRQLDCVSPECRALLRIAAILGREFDLELLASCVHEDIDALLSEACRRGVVCRSSLHPDGYRFTHALLHEVAARELDAAQRKRAHAEAAGALLAISTGEDARTDCRIARHLLESGEANGLLRASQLAERAGENARARGAYGEAAAALSLVAEVQRKKLALASGEDANSLRRELGRRLMAYAEMLWRAGQLTQARQEYDEVARIAEASEDPVLLADALLATLGDHIGSMSHEQRGQCERLCEPSSRVPLETQIRLLARMGAELFFYNERECGLELVRKALRLGATSSDPLVQTALLQAQRATLWDDGVGFAERTAQTERRFQIAARQHDLVETAWCHAHAAWTAMEFADQRGMRTHHEKFAELALRAGEPLIFLARVQACTIALLRGEQDRSDELLLESRQIGWHMPEAPNVLAFMYGAVRELQGCTEESVELCLRVLEHWDNAGTRAALAHQYCALGRVAEARLELERAFAAKPRGTYALCRLAEAAHDLANGQAAAYCYARLRHLDDRCAVSRGNVHCLGAVAYYAGIAALTTNDRSAAVTLLRKAVASNQALGAMPALARSHLALATALEPSEPDEARVHAETALQLADALHMTQLSLRAASVARDPTTREHSQHSQHDEAPSFERRGDYWHLRYRGQAAHVTDLKGMHYLEVLLAEPGQPKHVLELIAARAAPAPTAPIDDEGETTPQLEGYERALDGASIASYRRRVHELAEEAREAEAMHDLARQERVQRELTMLEQQLCAGTKARHRPTERARKAVYNRIRQAIQHVERSHTELARHLLRTIKTGAHCVYSTDDATRWHTGLSA